MPKAVKGQNTRFTRNLISAGRDGQKAGCIGGKTWLRKEYRPELAAACRHWANNWDGCRHNSNLTEEPHSLSRQSYRALKGQHN